MAEDPDSRPKTDEVLSDRARGPAERAVLGNNPTGSIVRVVGFIVLFVVVAGTLFYFLNR